MLDHWSLTSEALHGEPWRLWTGHIVHWGAGHVLVDVVAAVPPLLLLRARDRWWVVVWAIVAAPLISLGILSTTPGVVYRGVSAIVVGLWILVPLRERSVPGVILLSLCILKLTIETVTPARLGMAEVALLPIAHILGAVSGLAGYLAWPPQNDARIRSAINRYPSADG